MTTKRGADLLRDPRWNKNTAFTEAEREQMGLIGLLPDAVSTLDLQLKRALGQIDEKETDLERYIFLSHLQNLSETVFYALLMSDPTRFLPLVYTPTVGEACLKFGHILRHPRGMYLSFKRRGRVREVLQNWPEKDVRFIVVTDGGRILGLGDLGTNGMGIPIGKLALYTACGGVPPEVTMPMLLDCGTNNVALREDPLYLGNREARHPVADVDAFVEEVMTAIEDRYPGCCIQFEDFAGVDAIRYLEKYRDRFCCFNDDIQGTAAVALAGVLGALRVTGGKMKEQRFLFLGAGSAGTGIAGLLEKAMVLDGATQEEAHNRIWLYNRGGLVETTRKDLLPHQAAYAHPHEPIKDFAAAIESLRPTTIMGVSTLAKAFDRKVIEAISRVNERPIIFPYSNPTSHSECTAEEAYLWSNGRAVFAAGSPFLPVTIGERTWIPGQGNNVFIFPAVGMAVYATKARRVTDEMFIAAAHGVAEKVTQADIDVGLIYPPQSRLLETELHAAVRIAEVIFEQGLAGIERPKDLAGLMASKAYRAEHVRT